MSVSWCKVASNLDTHPKIRKAGRLGREIFLFALRRNAEPGNPVAGRIPKDELDAEYVGDMLQMTCDEAVTGVTAAVTAGLLTLDGDFYVIVSWKDGWGKTNKNGAERTAKWRENKKLPSGDKSGDAGDTRDSHGDTSDTDKKRRDKTTKTPSQGDAALTTILILKIIANHPGSTLAKLTPAEKTDKINSWANDIRLMREQDGHTESEIRAVIDWCQADSFWRNNILSADKLRKQWNQLVAKMGSKARPKQASAEQPALKLMIGGVEVER